MRKLSFAVASLLGAQLSPSISFAASETEALEVVVVTAQKRLEDSQSIGVSVTALSGDQLRELGIYETAAISALTPGVTISNILGGSVPTISIRGMGVGSASFFANQPNSAAINVDNVYLPSAIMSNFQLFDTERVEILKGPQGTLYGRNTTAGAINFFSRKPTFDANGYVQASYARWDTVRVETGFGGPLSDNVAYRVSAVYDDSEGDVTNRYQAPGSDSGPFKTNGTNRYAARTQLLYSLDETSVLFNLHGGKDESDSFHYQVLPVQLPGNPSLFGSDPECFTQYEPSYPQCLTGAQDPAQVDRDGNPYGVNSNLNTPSNIEAIGGSVQVTHDFGSVIFDSITAYDSFTRLYFEDEDGGPLSELHVYFDEDFRHASQELRLTSDTEGALQWIAGIYGSRLEAEMKRQADYTGVTERMQSEFIPWNGIVYSNEIRETSLAAFTHTTYQLTERLRAIAGLRYTNESKSIQVVNANIIGNSPLFAPINEDNYDIVNYRTNGVKRDDSWSEVSGKLGLEFAMTDDLLLYGNFSRGFKSGGFPGSLGVTPARLKPYKPEVADSYELGFKSNFAEGRGLFNVAAYYTDSKDRLEFATSPDGSFVDFTNAASTKIKGIEAQVGYRLPNDFNIDAAVAYSDATYDEFFDAGTQISYAGLTLPFAPEWTGNLQGSKGFDLSNGQRILATSNVSYTGRQFFNSANIAAASAEGYWLWNARVSYVMDQQGWSAALFAKNLLDEEYRAGGNSGVTGNNVYNPGQRRSLGLEIKYQW